MGVPETNEILVEKYRARIEINARVLKNRLPSNVLMEDLISCGFVGLLEAASRYDRFFGVKFETYAEIRIRGAMLDYLREIDFFSRRDRFFERKNGIPLNMIYVDEVDHSMFDGIAAQKFIDDEVREEAFGWIEKSMGGLTEGQRWIVVRCYIDGKTQKEVAEELGVSAATVCCGHQRAIRKMRKVMACVTGY